MHLSRDLNLRCSWSPGREERLVGEAKETLFIDERIEGVKGVFASERARAREGVLGWLYIGQGARKDKQYINSAFPTPSCVVTCEGG